MKKIFFEFMIWIDDHISHPVWDIIDKVFNKDNNTYFYSEILCNFCQWSWKGWNNTHPE
jgi:hypothetical protein